MVCGLKDNYIITESWENSQVGDFLFMRNIPTVIRGSTSINEKSYIEYFSELTDEDALFIKITFANIKISKHKR